jgi:CHAT domain-containing protein
MKQIEIYEGLFENRDGSDAQGSVRFYEDLIEAAIDRLPDSIDRLVIVPDSILYRFPFAALRADAAGQPLATRYTITYVPSATLWMRWKRRDSALVAGALSLADPESLSEEVASEVRSAAPWIDGLDLGPLPHGRREAEAVVRSLGGVIRVGHDTSKRFLKTTDVSSFGLLHFAAHAVIDQRSPERSAILLAPGSEKEDGLLQAREIVALDFDECVVVLSACRSASGELLEGEGVVGLAHAFFQAGARAVIGALWPIRDREAADLMEHLSAHLARGESVSKSLGAAQRALIEDGAPTAAWAGLVVLGDGDSVSVRAAPNRVSTGSVVAVAALLMAVTGLVGWRILAYRRRLRSRD